MARKLTVEDLRRGGVDKYRKVEVDGFFPDGEKGIIYHTPIPAKFMLRFVDDGGNLRVTKEVIEELADTLHQIIVNEDGTALFSSRDEFLSLSLPTLVKVFSSIGSQQDTDSGNASSGAAGEATSIASPTSSALPQGSDTEAPMNSSTD